MAEHEARDPREVRVALVGIGAWGRNLARNYAQMPGAELRWICDRDPRRLADASRNFPHAMCTPDYARVLADPATPSRAKRLFVDNLVDSLEAVLAAPPSDATVAALGRRGVPTARRG